MEYIKGTPYFGSNKSKRIKQYSYLDKDIKCDILIIGGGIDGAIANYYLSKKYNVALVDKSRLGMGCTSCATALLEYQLDNFAKILESYLSKSDICDIYHLGLNSIEKLEEFVKINGNHCFFSKRPTFLFSTSDFDLTSIKNEYLFRKENGFPCNFITKENNPFNFELSCGLYAEDGGAELDPYLFTKQLIESSTNQKSIFENTKINKIIKKNNEYICETSFKNTITTKNVILATGFNFDLVKNNKLCTKYTSYTIVTNPLPELKWFNMALIQDSLSPYHYLRFLPDNRIIFGGEDTILKKSISQKTAQKKYEKLLATLRNLFPIFKSKIKVDYKFCGAFGSTKNNLGLIGKDEKGVIYFISCGANGIINAMAGVDILDDILNGKTNRFEKFFSPKRRV